MYRTDQYSKMTVWTIRRTTLKKDCNIYEEYGPERMLRNLRGCWATQSPCHHGGLERGQTSQTHKSKAQAHHYTGTRKETNIQGRERERERERETRRKAKSPGGRRSKSKTSGMRHQQPARGAREVPGLLVVQHRGARVERERDRHTAVLVGQQQTEG